MKLPKGWGISSIELELYDECTNSLTLKATSDGGKPYVELLTTELGVGLGFGDLYRLADIAEELLTMYEDTIPEAPDAGAEPATGYTPTADKEPLI